MGLRRGAYIEQFVGQPTAVPTKNKRLAPIKIMLPQQLAFIDSILKLNPRLAVFDCDGTLWSGDAGERFFDWELRRGVVPDEIARWARARYAEYRDGRVSEEDMCGEMVTLHRGLKEENVQALAAEFIEENFVKQFFPEMQQLILDLQHA